MRLRSAQFQVLGLVATAGSFVLVSLSVDNSWASPTPLTSHSLANYRVSQSPNAADSAAEDLTLEAEDYAKSHGQTLQESITRLTLMPSMSEFLQTAESKYPDRFAGGWIDNGDPFRLVISFTQGPELADITAEIASLPFPVSLSYDQSQSWADKVGELNQALPLLDAKLSGWIAFTWTSKQVKRFLTSRQAVSPSTSSRDKFPASIPRPSEWRWSLIEPVTPIRVGCVCKVAQVRSR